MPTSVKLALSAVVLVVGALCAWLEARYADTTVAVVIACLAAFMIVALWLFPEAGVKDGEQSPD